MSLSIDILRKSLPDKYKATVSQELLDTINDTLADPDLFETYRDNFKSPIVQYRCVTDKVISIRFK